MVAFRPPSYARDRIISDAVLRWVYERYARPREFLRVSLRDGIHPVEVDIIRGYFAEFSRALVGRQ
jgi:hypothetical protein